MLGWMFAEFRALGQAWNRFWFDSRSEDTLTALGAYRVMFGAVALFFYFTRALDLSFFYSEEGILPLSHLRALPGLEYRPTLLAWIPGITFVLVLHSLFLLALLSLTLGFFTRFSAILAFVLHLNFMNRNPAILFGMDTIGTYFLFYLCLANSGARYSLDAYFGRARNSQGPLSHIAWRLMQVQVCVVYAYSGLEKLKGMRWWDGSALWDVLSIGNMQRFDLSIVSHFPLLLSGAVYLVLLWEVFFPALIWVPRLRLPMLAFGVFMHIGIILFMNLPSFGLLMIANYLLFLKADEIGKGLAETKRVLRLA